jgi:hypothetical protein
MFSLPVAQVGLSEAAAGAASAASYGVASIIATWTALFGCLLGLISFATTLFQPDSAPRAVAGWTRVIVDSALGALGCFVMYVGWWWGVGEVPTEWYCLLAAVGGGAAGTGCLFWQVWHNRITLK